MKVLLLFVIVTLALGKEIGDDIIKSWEDVAKPHLSDCAKESGLSESEAENIMKNKIMSTHAHKCYTKCLDVRLGLFDPETRNFNIDGLVKKIKGMTREIAEECFTKYKDEKDDCELVFASGMCFIEKITKDR
ncbi:hypothetical protein RI129_002103 [Pyrocoelia pectoralis]|uniref:Uncharacterized protein n=1 Tax=Pyrocoelia pectoralis TaxID=417401 RepID=A0AAN7ZSN5_9COLE